MGCALSACPETPAAAGFLPDLRHAAPRPAWDPCGQDVDDRGAGTVTSLTHLAAPLAPGMLVDHNQRELGRVVGRSHSSAPSTTRAVRRRPLVAAAQSTSSRPPSGSGSPGSPGCRWGWRARPAPGALARHSWPSPAPTRPGRSVSVWPSRAAACSVRAAALALTSVAVAAVADLAAGPGELLLVSGAVAVASLAPRVARDIVDHPHPCRRSRQDQGRRRRQTPPRRRAGAGRAGAEPPPRPRRRRRLPGAPAATYHLRRARGRGPRAPRRHRRRRRRPGP